MFTSVRWSRVAMVLLPFFALIFGACVGLVPEFSYQGRLLDDSGEPVPDGDYEMTISIYQAATGGTEVYSQTQSIPVENGLFTTAVGPAEEMDPEIFSQPTWMEVAVEGEVLSPRQRLQGSPFAFSLTSGAVVQGEETIERTFAGNENTGAVLTVWNRDANATGGNALVVVNQAAAAGTDRDVTAALQAIAGGGQLDGVDPTNDTGAYGAIVRSENYRGMYAKGGEIDGSGYYAAVFESPSGIQIIGGSCDGCTQAYMAVNVGQEPLVKGDFVSINGVTLDEELNIPVMQVAKAVAGDTAVIGVASGAVTREPISEVYGAQVGGYNRVSGPAESGAFLSVAVQGLVQANVGSGTGLQLGQSLDDPASGSPAIGRLMSVVNEDGLAWVMLSGE